MKTLYVILKNTILDGSHEVIKIDGVASASIDDMYLMIYSYDEDDIVITIMGKFDLSEIVGYWFEEI